MSWVRPGVGGETPRSAALLLRGNVNVTTINVVVNGKGEEIFMAKTYPLGVRLPPDVKSALEQAAATDLRSQSSMAEKIITDWLKANGYLPKP